MGPEILIGTAPFCDPNPQQCYISPGYQPVRRDKANCWTGEKVVCKFNIAAWKQTGMFNELKREMGADAEFVIPVFQWFGSAPVCNATYCDVFTMGYMPIVIDPYGDGAPCGVGDKILGMRPILKSHFVLVDEGRRNCYKESEQRSEIIKKCLDIGNELIKQLAKAMAVTSIAPAEFDQATNNYLTTTLGVIPVPQSMKSLLPESKITIYKINLIPDSTSMSNFSNPVPFKGENDSTNTGTTKKHIISIAFISGFLILLVILWYFFVCKNKQSSLLDY